nr:PREDICTED: cytochrome b-c1 complex subunit 10 [Apteryx mantelli mantelli]
MVSPLSVPALRWRIGGVYLRVSLFFRTPTLVTWGGVAGTGLIWFTDWKLILQYVPYIGGKYKKED